MKVGEDRAVLFGQGLVKLRSRHGGRRRQSTADRQSKHQLGSGRR